MGNEAFGIDKSMHVSPHIKNIHHMNIKNVEAAGKCLWLSFIHNTLSAESRL